MTAHPATTVSDGVAVSADGSQIAYSRRGTGPTVILVAGAFVHRGFGTMHKIADQLVDAFTVVTYDRRDRGASKASTRDYEVAREFQDLQALINTNDGHAHLFGWSSGASLVLQAAPGLQGADSIAIYETPYIVDDSRAPHPDGYIARHDELVTQGRNAALIDYFMTVGIGLPRIIPALSRLNPQWRKMKALAPTLAHDARLVNPYARGIDYPPDTFAGISVPVWVGWGSKSPQWIRHSNRRVAEHLAGQCPTATTELAGQTHLVKPAAIAPAVREHFNRHCA